MDNNEINVLYIEDNNADIQLLRTYIDYNNIPVSLKAFAKFYDALNYLNCFSESVDIILLDYCLIGINCEDALKQLKNNEKSKHIPVIIFSNWAGENDREKCIKDNAVGFVIKPHDFENYSELIQVIMNHNKKLPSLIN